MGASWKTLITSSTVITRLQNPYKFLFKNPSDRKPDLLHLLAFAGNFGLGSWERMALKKGSQRDIEEIVMIPTPGYVNAGECRDVEASSDIVEISAKSVDSEQAHEKIEDLGNPRLYFLLVVVPINQKFHIASCL